MTSIKFHNILGLLLWFPQSLVAAVLQNLTWRWERMEILRGERADGVFTLKSNDSNLFRGRAAMCDCRSQESREPGHCSALILHFHGSFPTGSSTPRAGMSLAPLALQSPFTFGMKKGKVERILLLTVKNHSRWQWSPFWVHRDEKCHFCCGFHPPLLSAAVFL